MLSTNELSRSLEHNRHAAATRVVGLVAMTNQPEVPKLNNWY